MSKADDRHYARLEAQNKMHMARMAKLEERLPRRMEVLAMVKAGKMTLEAAQKLIKKEERALDMMGKKQGKNALGR